MRCTPPRRPCRSIRSLRRPRGLRIRVPRARCAPTLRRRSPRRETGAPGSVLRLPGMRPMPRAAPRADRPAADMRRSSPRSDTHSRIPPRPGRDTDRPRRARRSNGWRRSGRRRDSACTRGCRTRRARRCPGRSRSSGASRTRRPDPPPVRSPPRALSRRRAARSSPGAGSRARAPARAADRSRCRTACPR